MKFNEFKKKRRPGFTLVEMVVVVTILGILAGLGFMKFDQVQVKAKQNADYISATNLATAANLYINDDASAIQEKDGKKIVDINQLKSKGYVNSIPKPQSVIGNFDIIISSEKGVIVNVGQDEFYPEITTPSSSS